MLKQESVQEDRLCDAGKTGTHKKKIGSMKLQASAG